MYRTGNIRRVYQLVRQIGGRRSPQPGIGIKDKDGKMLYEKDKIERRWQEYGKQLFASDIPPDKVDEQPPEELDQKW